MNRITINGVTIQTNNNCISISDGKIIVDGNEVNVGDTHSVIINGNVKELKVTGKVEVKGNVEGNVNAGGSVDAGGSVTAANISGDIDAGGSVHIRK